MFDADRDLERLDAAGYRSDMIPLFALANDDGTATGKQTAGGIKGDGAVAQIVPRLRALLDGKEVTSAAQWDRAVRGDEGAVVGDLWEWVRADTGPARRGHKGGHTGGFRCTSPAALLLGLLAI